MRRELLDRAHDQARTELGFCVQAPDGNWCDAHQALKFPGEEACRVMSVAYTIAESAVEVAEPIIEERFSGWMSPEEVAGQMELVRADERERVATEISTCGRGDCATYRTLSIIRDRGGVYGYSRDAAEAITSAIADIIRHGPQEVSE